MNWRELLILSARAEQEALRHAVGSEKYERYMSQARAYLDKVYE